MQRFSKKIVVFVILLDVLIAFVSAVGAYAFGQVWNFFGSTADFRFMLIFVVLAVVGAVILTVALRRNINPLWAVVAFVPPLCAATVWFLEYMIGSTLVIEGIIAFGLPVIAFLGGIALGIYMRLVCKHALEADVE